MDPQGLPDEIWFRILQLVHNSYKASAPFIGLRFISKMFNDCVLHILFVQGHIKVIYPRSLHLQRCNEKLCNQAYPADFSPWPTCLARYELQGALARSSYDPPKSRRLRLYVKKIKAAINTLETELSKPEHAVLIDELSSYNRFLSVTECPPLTGLVSKMICQSIVTYFGEAWYVNSLRHGPSDWKWHIAERYTYINAYSDEPSQGVKTVKHHEKRSYRCWILLTACYVGSVTLFLKFSRCKRRRRRGPARRIVQLLYLDFLTVAAKNGHVDLVKYLVSIQDRASTQGEDLYHLILRAAIYSGKTEIVGAVLKLPQMNLHIVSAFTGGNVSCLLAYDQDSRHAIMNLIDEHCPDAPHTMCIKIMEGAYSLADFWLLNKYMSKASHVARRDLLISSIHGLPHEAHLECVRVTSVTPSLDLQYPMAWHTPLAKQFLIRNRLDLFLKLDKLTDLQPTMTVFPWLVYADGAETYLIERCNEINGSSEAALSQAEWGSLPVELAASALRSRALAILLAAGARPYHTVKQLRVPYSVCVGKQDLFHRTKAVLEQYDCCPLVLEVLSECVMWKRAILSLHQIARCEFRENYQYSLNSCQLT